MTVRAGPDIAPTPAPIVGVHEAKAAFSEPVRGVRAYYRKSRRLINTIISVMLGLAAWEFAAHHTSQLVMAPLETIWSSFFTQLHSGALGLDVATTFEGFVIGVAIASVGGILIGLLMATNDLAFDLLDPWISALRSTPLITIAPLFIVALGIGLTAKVAVVTLVAIFPVIINTADGIRTADRGLIEAAYAFGARRRDVFIRVLIPSALPFIISGLRLAITFGLIGEVVAEFFGSRAGIGYMVFQAAQTFDTGTVFLGVFILAAVGVIITKLMYRAERRIAPWRSFDVNATRRT